MGDNSKIEWTEATWNPVTGCTKVSPGCDHCYAERITERFGSKGSFTQVTLHEDRLSLPLWWRKPRKVFVNSMSDLFHDAVPDEFLERIFDVMEKVPGHTFQVLTKRHARMRSFVRARKQRKEDYALAFENNPIPERRTCPAAIWARQRADNPPANIWLGVSAENQQWADIRIPALLGTPAAVRFLSCEPLLGPVNLRQAAQPDMCGSCDAGLPMSCTCPPKLDWIIAGGESGPGARPMNPAWARSLRDQCQDAGIPFFFKQWGEWAPSGWRTGTYGPMTRMGKRNAGRELDGRTWDEYPGNHDKDTP